MSYSAEERAEARDLSRRPAVEYAGATAPGQVLATVFRAYYAAVRLRGLGPDAVLATTEQGARHQLTAELSSPSSRRSDAARAS